MRIAFLNRGRETHEGGDLIALDATMAALRRRGIECVETGWDSEQIKHFDLAHVFHCQFSWSWGNYEAIKRAGKPYVLTPVFYPGPLLSGIEWRQLEKIVLDSSRVLTFSRKEMLEMYNASTTTGIPLALSSAGYSIIPNGTDPAFHCRHLREVTPSLRRVLTVSARGESDKNVGTVKRICERSDIPFHCATDLPHADLPAVYAGYGVFVNASGSERMSLTIGEALCANCRVLATRENQGNEWYEGLVTFDPNDETKLEHLIRWATTSPTWDYRPNAAARCLTWDWVAMKLEAVYREVLGW